MFIPIEGSAWSIIKRAICTEDLSIVLEAEKSILNKDDLKREMIVDFRLMSQEDRIRAMWLIDFPFRLDRLQEILVQSIEKA